MKRIFAVIFVLIVLAAFTPLGCFADGEPIGLTCSYLNTNGGKLDEGRYTLEEDKCTYDNSITLNGDVTLDLNGNQLIADGISDISLSSLSISGDGKVELTTNGITVNGSITISNGSTVEASGAYYGIYSGRDITISGENTKVTAKATGEYGIGFYAGLGITISGDDTQVTAKATSTSSGDVKPAGIYAAGKIDILGGTVKEASGAYYGIYSGGDITISGAQTQVTAEATGVYGSGIFSGNGGITIESGGTVKEVSGGTYGIYAYVDITIDGGTVKNVFGG